MSNEELIAVNESLKEINDFYKQQAKEYKEKYEDLQERYDNLMLNIQTRNFDDFYYHGYKLEDLYKIAIKSE